MSTSSPSGHRRKIAAYLLSFLLPLALARADNWRPAGPGSDGRSLYGTWFANANEGWAVGHDGKAIRHTTDGGVTWSDQITPFSAANAPIFYDIWGVDANNVWVVGGGGTVLKYNGNTWSAQSTGVTDGNDHLFGVWGTDVNNVWAVGGAQGYIINGTPVPSYGSIYKWDGTSWTAQTSGSAQVLLAVWGSSTNNVWAVGYGGTILKWDGTAWTADTSGTSVTLNNITGLDASNVWVVGGGGVIRKWDGAAWSAQSSGTTGPLYNIYAADASNLWVTTGGAAVLKWDGSTWNSQATGAPGSLGAISGVGTSNVWAVGPPGVVVKWNGSAWSTMTYGPPSALHAVWGVDANNIWAVGGYGSTIVKWNGSAWNTQSSPSIYRLRGLWGADANNIWAVGENGTILKYNGTTWTAQTSGTTRILNGVWGTDASNVWAVGEFNTILKWNGSSWSVHDPNPGVTLTAIWGLSATDIWAVGYSGVVRRWNGSTWTTQGLVTSNDLQCVWGANSSNVWVGGINGTRFKWNGSTWTNQSFSSPNNEWILGLWGTSASNVYCVGLYGLIHKWNGFTWTPQAVETAEHYYAAWGVNGSHVYAVGGDGLIRTNAPFGPTVTTNAASNITSSSAALNATINPGGGVTSGVFDYAPVGSLVFTGDVPIVLSPDDGSTPQNVSSTATGLAPGTFYYYRASATNAFGTTLGSNAGFTTLDGPDIAVEQPAGTNLVDGTATVAYGSINVGVPSVKTFTLKNTGTLSLSGIVITKDGTSAADFTVGAPGATSLAPGGSTTFDVTLNTATTGTKSAAIHIASDDPDENPFDIALTATSTSPEIAVEQPAGTNLTDNVSAIAYNNVLLGASSVKTFTIKNTGTSTLNLSGVTKDGTNAADFTIGALGSSTVAPGGSTTFDVTFSPGALGARSAALHIGSDDTDENPFDIALTGSGVAPEIAVEQPAGTDLTDSVSSIAYGSTTPGTPVVKTFTVKNLGSSTLTLSGITKDGANAADFTVSAPGSSSLAASASTTFTVTFDPAALGAKTAAIHIGSDDANENPFDISLTGSGVIQAVYRQGSPDPFAGGTYAGMEDVWLFTNGPSTFTDIRNTGGDTRVIVGGLSATQPRRQLMRWNIASLAGQFASITKITVRLTWLTNATPSATVADSVRIYRPIATWVEGNGQSNADPSPTSGWSTWSHRLYNSTFWPGSAGMSTPGTDYVNTIIGTKSFNLTELTDDLFDIEITDPTLISNWLAGNNSGLFMRMIGEVGQVMFHSSEGTTVSKRPQLIIEYVPAAPEIVVEQPAGTGLTDGSGSIEYGGISTGASAVKTFTIRNLGSGTAQLTGLAITKDGTDAADFTVSTLGATTLANAASTTFTVTFNPTTVGTKSAAIHIASNDGDENPFDITLGGTGAVLPEIGVEEPAGTNLSDGITTTSFGDSLLGTPVVKTFTVRNGGTSTLNLTGVTVDGTNAAEYVAGSLSATVLAPADTATFTVTFTPTAVGARTAAIHVGSDDTDENPFDVNLTGTGIAPEIAVEQPAGTNLTDGTSTVAYGGSLIGTPVVKTFTIKNTGGAPLSGIAVTLDGASAAEFSVGTPGATSLAPAGSTTFTVTFTPVTPGIKTAAIHVASNDADENPFDLALSASGTAPPGNWRVAGPHADGRPLRRVWFADANTGWSVGGTTGGFSTVRFTNDGGVNWSSQLSGTASDLQALSGVNASNVWAVGLTGAIVKYNGTSWGAQTSGTTQDLYGVWAADVNNVWAVGLSGTIRKWNGSTWSAQTSGTTQGLVAVWGLNTSNVWAVGTGGTILKFNGTAWAAQTSGTTQILRAVWGTDANNVWAAGDAGVIQKFNGTSWVAQTSGISTRINSLAGTDTSNVWAVGQSGVVRKFNGTAWSAQTSGTTQELYGNLHLDASTGWAVGDSGAILKWNGTAWSSPTTGTSNALRGLWGSDAGNVWAAGDTGVIYKGNAATGWVAQTSGTTQPLYGLWGTDANNIWASGGAGTIRKWNGTAWGAQTSNTPNNLFGIGGVNASNIWAVGNTGTIIKFNGTTWSVQTSGITTTLNSVFAADVNNVWAVGSSGVIRKWNGSAWSGQTSGTANTLNKVWGVDANTVWAVGSAGTILKWNGTAWSTKTSGTASNLLAIWGADAGNLWVSGVTGLLLKSNDGGETWSTETSTVTASLNAVWGAGSLPIFAAGFGGVIITNAPTPTVVTTLAATSVTAYGATLNGTIHPEGVTTTAKFQHGLTTGYGTDTTITLSPDNGSAYQNVSTVLTGLTSNTTYNFRVSATNGGGTFNGANMTFTTSAVPEIAVEQPVNTALTDGSSTILFGTTAQGVQVVKTFTIRNTGTASLTISGVTKDGTHAADYALGSLSSSTLAPAATATFDVTFNPNAGGTRTAAIHIASNDATESPFDIDLTGNGAVPEIAVEQPTGTDLTDGSSTVSLGGTAPNTSVLKSFAIRNTGTADITVSGITKDGTHAADYAIGTLSSSTITPGNTATFDVTFTPSSAGVKTAAIHIASNDTDENPFDINLTGTGAVAEISVQQPVGTELSDGVSTIGFGLVNVGSTSAAITFTVANPGNADLTGIAVTKDGANAGDFTVTLTGLGSTLPPVSSATFTVAFTPGALGARTAALHIASNDTDENPFDIALTGTGADLVTLTPALNLPATNSTHTNPISVDFTLPEAALPGSVTLTFNDGVTPRVLTLAASQETLGNHSFSFVSSNPTATAAIASGVAIPDGSYTVTLQYQDAPGNPAAAASSTNVTIDTTTLTPSLTAPASSTTTGSPISVNYSLPETAAAGSVKLTFDDGVSPLVLTLAAAREAVGAHSFSFIPATPLASSSIASGPVIPDGGYSVTLSYQDSLSNPVATSAAATGVAIDTTGPTGGSMTMTPASPVDASEALGVSFTSWTDPHTPLTYQVLVDNVPVNTPGASATVNFTGPTAPGAHTLKGRVFDTLGNVTEVTQNFTVHTPTQSWRELYFGTGENTGTAADDFDFDSDGLDNLLEFATHLNPTTASVLPTPTTLNGANIEFIYDRSVAALADGIIFEVEWNDTLAAANWSTVGVTESILSDNGTVQQVKALVPAGSGERYVRLKVTRP